MEVPRLRRCRYYASCSLHDVECRVHLRMEHLEILPRGVASGAAAPRHSAHASRVVALLGLLLTCQQPEYMCPGQPSVDCVTALAAGSRQECWPAATFMSTHTHASARYGLLGLPNDA